MKLYMARKSMARGEVPIGDDLVAEVDADVMLEWIDLESDGRFITVRRVSFAVVGSIDMPESSRELSFTHVCDHSLETLYQLFYDELTHFARFDSGVENGAIPSGRGTVQFFIDAVADLCK